MTNNDSACKDIHDSVPTALSHLIGNELLMTKVRVAIEAAHIDRTRFEHCLLVGPPGMGKSTLASVIASEMAVAFHEYLGQRLRTPADLNEVLLAVRPRSCQSARITGQ